MCLTVEPAWYNKVPWDWQHMFAITRFFYFEVQSFAWILLLLG